MKIVSIIVFIALVSVAAYLFAKQIKTIIRNIKLGKDVNRSDNPSKRWITMIKVALGQSKMVVRPVAGIMHIFIYAAFIFTQIELIEIILDGITGSHRLIWNTINSSFLAPIYTFAINLIEVLSVLAFVATITFLSRRNIIKLARFQKPEMKGWPSKDANIILCMEIFLITCVMLMNSGDLALQAMGVNHPTAQFVISSHIAPLWAGLSEGAIHIIERAGWWGHLLGILGFLVYLPHSKHFHVLISFPNVYFSNLQPKGKFANNEVVTREVKLMLDPAAVPPTDAAPVGFGAKDVKDLTWKQLMDAYSCTECGRCTSVCPQNNTGKKLSPRKIMMDTRDRLEEVGKNIDLHGADYTDNKSLLGDYITPEEIWACNTCNACVDACPVNIDPLSIIMDLRQYLVMEQSAPPSELAGMFSNIENNGAPWQFSAMDRLNWANED
ncbi:MAG: (Fe-S)-binding protein [Bacteroidia bacterium]|nr:(Fe-S)-binding protein [Bacteroidia bacterium]